MSSFPGFQRIREAMDHYRLAEDFVAQSRDVILLAEFHVGLAAAALAAGRTQEALNAARTGVEAAERFLLDPKAGMDWYERELDRPRTANAPRQARLLRQLLSEARVLTGDLAIVTGPEYEGEPSIGWAVATIWSGEWERGEQFWTGFMALNHQTGSKIQRAE